MSLKQIRNPELFQGNLEKKNYFEGWYFKHVTADGKHTIAFIPGVSIDGANSHCFVQVIMSPNIKTFYFKYPIEVFTTTTQPFSVIIGESVFSMQGCKIELHDASQKSPQGISFTGEIRYSDIMGIQSSPLTPNIMGFFAYIPNMECNHGVLSMNHKLAGQINVSVHKSQVDHQFQSNHQSQDEPHSPSNHQSQVEPHTQSIHQTIDFTGGKGYIEKDWGISFPSEYIWIQANHFEDDAHSFMCSIATIPFGLFSFRGLIANLHVDGIEYRFATYNRAKVKNLVIETHRVAFDLVKGDIMLSCEAKLTETGVLKAPDKGEMQRTIKEGISGEAKLTLQRKGHKPLTLNSACVSIEIVHK